MPLLSERTEAELILDLLFHGLRVRDPKLNALAAELLVRFGVQPVPRLVHVAVCRKNSPSYRERAMAVLEQIGELSSYDDFLELSLLLNDRNPRVREAAWRLLGRVAPAGRLHTRAARQPPTPDA